MSLAGGSKNGVGTTGGVASPGPWARARVFLQAPSARHARSQAEKLALTRGPRRLAVIGGRAAECRPSALRSSGSLFSSLSLAWAWKLDAVADGCWGI